MTTHPRKHRKHLKTALWVGLTSLACLLLFGGILIISVVSDLPSLDLLQNRQVSESTKIYDRTGTKLIYEVYGEERRTIIPFEKIPQHLKDATLAIEDGDFYNHSALDFNGLLRAIITDIRTGTAAQGGSTITQQLAKNAFLTNEKTLTRKFKEVIIAYKLERTFTKDQILELYLNQIPYGNNAYGIESAAQTYFQKAATDLTLGETALLASLPQAPSYYDPFGSHVKDLLARQSTVLQRMTNLGFITADERDAAAKEKLAFNRLQNLQTAPHFVLAVKQYLNDQYGEEYVSRAGLKVITTLDTDLQASAEKAVAAGAARNTELYKGTNAALVAQDPKTGQILAMVGSRNFFDKEIDGQFNVATQGLRQPGSALKPFVYLAALKAGYPEKTVLFDTQTEFSTSEDPTKSYAPENYDGIFRGPVNFRSALAESINIPAVKTLYLVGLDNFLAFLKSLGINTLSDRSRFGLSLVLGGGEVHLQELVGAYSVLAQEGVRHDQHIILSVTDQNGKILEQYQDIAEPVIDPEYPRIINDMLADKTARAPLFSGSLNLTVYPGYDVALKTGTSNDYRDAWSVSYTPNIVAGVWAGNNDNKPMEKKGGSILAAVPILNAFMREALPLRPVETFVAPDPITSSKPMLSGQYIATYQSGGGLYKQVHDILYYVDKRNPLGPTPAHPENDSQFTNWEKGVQAWATATIPGYQSGITYNQPVPPDAVFVDTASDSTAGSIIILAPAAGDFIKNGQLFISAQIQSQKQINSIQIFFNGQLVDSRTGEFGNTPTYQNVLSTGAGNPQNTVRIVATDITNQQIMKEVVVYQ